MAAQAETKLRWKAQEFARMAGVTVRTLHHYDRLGLLRPSGRTESGYRLYDDRDLVRLEQITVLKFLGLSLKQIRQALQGERSNLGAALRTQLWALAEKRRRLDVAIQAIGETQKKLLSGAAADAAIFNKLFEVIQVQNDTDWMLKYYDEASRAKVEERKKFWSPELQERVSREWAQLLTEVEAALGEDPASLKAQELARRWNALVEEFTGGDSGIAKGLKALYWDQANWPSSFKQPFSSDAAAFIAKACAAARKS